MDAMKAAVIHEPGGPGVLQIESRPIPSVWGHIAGGPGLNPVDVKFIDDALKELLAG
jgi:NADPH:quinone reductase-like Zn-dependent oxidoreductase